MRPILVAVCLLVATSVQAKSYDLADLETLAKQSAWQELLDHAEDVAPALRNDRWNKLVEDAGTNVLAALDTEKLTLAALATVDQLTHRYPMLAKSKPFMARRADIGMRAFTRCFEATGEDNEDADACAQRLGGFADADPDNADLARRAIALIEKYLHANTSSALPLYARLIAGKKGAKDCSSAGAKKAVITSLELEKTDPRVASARDIASRLCWDAMQNELVDALGQPHANPHYFENSCGFLVEKKALGNLMTKRCQALPK
jgi:hypothetical protein